MVGDFKKTANFIGDLKTTNPKNVSSEIAKLLKSYNELKSVNIEDIINFHHKFESIHPFEDGNGRTGRIITNAHLLHNNLAPIIITSSMKNIYLNCISNRDHQTLGNLFRMLASVTTSQLIAYYRKVKGISPDDIGGKRGKPNK